jgi:hypothetical protein
MTTKLTAIEPVKCGGKRYAPGDSFETDDKVAEQLVASGAASGPGKSTAKADAEAKAKGG